MTRRYRASPINRANLLPSLKGFPEAAKDVYFCADELSVVSSCVFRFLSPLSLRQPLVLLEAIVFACLPGRFPRLRFFAAPSCLFSSPEPPDALSAGPIASLGCQHLKAAYVAKRVGHPTVLHAPGVRSWRLTFAAGSKPEAVRAATRGGRCQCEFLV